MFHIEESLYTRREFRWDKVEFSLRFGEREDNLSVDVTMARKRVRNGNLYQADPFRPVRYLTSLTGRVM